MFNQSIRNKIYCGLYKDVLDPTSLGFLYDTYGEKMGKAHDTKKTHRTTFTFVVVVDFNRPFIISTEQSLVREHCLYCFYCLFVV